MDQDTNWRMTLTEELLQVLLLECRKEDREDEEWPAHYLGESGRKAIWVTAQMFNVEGNGVPGQACRLLERYLAKKTRDAIGVDNETWHSIKCNWFKNMPLWMANCVVLANKANDYGPKLNNKNIQIQLLTKGLQYTLEEVSAAESDIYNRLDFHIPTRTSVQIATILAEHFGLTGDVLEGVTLITNIAELKRNMITEQVRWIVLHEKCNFYSSKVLTLHLAAAAVVTSSRYFSYYVGPELMEPMADLIHVPHRYVKCISDVILSEIFIELEKINK